MSWELQGLESPLTPQTTVQGMHRILARPHVTCRSSSGASSASSEEMGLRFVGQQSLSLAGDLHQLLLFTAVCSRSSLVHPAGQ